MNINNYLYLKSLGNYQASDVEIFFVALVTILNYNDFSGKVMIN